MALWSLSRTTWVSRYQNNIHPLTPIVVINHPLSASSIFYDPWHPPCSIYVPDSLFPQPLSKFSLVCPLAWHLPHHTPYISSPNHCLLFTAHAHTIATASHTTAVQSPYPYQWYILIGKQWYQLPEFIPSSLNFGLHNSISISVYNQHVTSLKGSLVRRATGTNGHWSESPKGQWPKGHWS